MMYILAALVLVSRIVLRGSRETENRTRRGWLTTSSDENSFHQSILLLWFFFACVAAGQRPGPRWRHRAIKRTGGAYAVSLDQSGSGARPARCVTVALVEPDSDEPIMNARCAITATPQTGQPLVAEATHKNATVKSYYEVDMELTETGPLRSPWPIRTAMPPGSARFTVQVERAGANTAAIGLGGVAGPSAAV